jgi:hypothetical protein
MVFEYRLIREGECIAIEAKLRVLTDCRGGVDADRTNARTNR